MSDNVILDNANEVVLEENKSFWEELKEFWNELVDLLYTDLHNSYLFLTENKNYFICAVLLAILLQFTSISTLGSSFDKYCNKAINNQSGGDGGAPAPQSESEIQTQQNGDNKKEQREKKKREKEEKKRKKEEKKQLKKV